MKHPDYYLSNGEKVVLICFILAIFLFGAMFGSWWRYELVKQEALAISGCWAIKEQVFNTPYPIESFQESGRRIMMERKRREGK